MQYECKPGALLLCLPQRYDPHHQQRHSAQFAERYSVRQRRTVEFYDPAAVGSQQEASHQPPGTQGDGRRAREEGRDREEERRRRERSRKRSRHGGATPEEVRCTVVGSVFSFYGGVCNQWLGGFGGECELRFGVVSGSRLEQRQQG